MMETGKQTETETPAAGAKVLPYPERGAIVYGEGKNRKSHRVRRMYVVGDVLAVIGFIGLGVIILAFTFLVFQFPFLVQALGALLTGALLYWAALFIGDIRRVRRALRPLRVYELGVRLPTGPENDYERGRPPKFLFFSDIMAFYPNEAGLDLPYFVVTLKDPSADPIIVPKELIGNWGKFRKAVKERMEAHKGWFFLKGVGPAFGGQVEADDLHLRYGTKENVTELSWDMVAERPKSHMKGLKNRAVVTIVLRKGGKLKFLVTLGQADNMDRSYQKYVNRFWKEPEKEEARWEKIEVPEDERDED
jgi:uncharacterized integral membrane protein